MGVNSGSTGEAIRGSGGITGDGMDDTDGTFTAGEVTDGTDIAADANGAAGDVNAAEDEAGAECPGAMGGPIDGKSTVSSAAFPCCPYALGTDNASTRTIKSTYIADLLIR